jgi:hypothetical protein
MIFEKFRKSLIVFRLFADAEGTDRGTNVVELDYRYAMTDAEGTDALLRE